MAKYRVYDTATVFYLIGEYEADSEDQAEEMAAANPQNDQPGLCWQCAGEFELGEFCEYQTHEVEAK